VPVVRPDRWVRPLLLLRRIGPGRPAAGPVRPFAPEHSGLCLTLVVALSLPFVRLAGAAAANLSGFESAGWPCFSIAGCRSSAGCSQVPEPRRPATPAPVAVDRF